MTNNWTHYNPVKITAGLGSISKLPDLLPTQGNILLITTPGATRRGLSAKVSNLLGADRIHIHDQVTPNPELDALDKWTSEYSSAGFAAIIALGGGSVLDAAKVLGVTLPSGVNSPLEQLFRQKKDITWSSRIPVTAIPTTSGTGAEVTPFATVWDGLNKKKHSLSGDNVYPAHALLDPELTLTLPRHETLYTGLDAISHALESLWNKNRTPVSEGFALHALTLANQALPIILKQPDDLESRASMQQASLLAGLAISQTKTAIAHAISYPLTIHYNIPHGLACSFALTGLIDLYFPILDNSQEKQVLLDISDILNYLQLDREMAVYLDGNNMHDHMDEMFHPERAGNCSLELSRQDVAGLLVQA